MSDAGEVRRLKNALHIENDVVIYDIIFRNFNVQLQLQILFAYGKNNDDLCFSKTVVIALPLFRKAH